MVLLQRVLAIFLMLVGLFLTMSVGYGLETRWDPHPLILAMLLPTCALFVAGLILAWLSYPRARMLEALLAIGGGAITFALLLRFGPPWDDYVKHYGSPLQMSVLLGTSLLAASITFLGMWIGQRVITRLRRPRISGPALLVCAIASAIVVGVCFLGTRDDLLGFLMASSVILFLPALCVVTMSLILAPPPAAHQIDDSNAEIQQPGMRRDVRLGSAACNDAQPEAGGAPTVRSRGSWRGRSAQPT